ncbi:hypothetical protein GCM10015535_28710 [Streptomyces gelaticus]|uniref:Uncharacterized protein n=1 Tax=Streptomyces gelaticus TaxID=285446 RepID=A0ABQ2VYM5_9ACTN|nr:hypothetical protein GCM10015535_28710 [Streptomyces gelaticus]
MTEPEPKPVPSAAAVRKLLHALAQGVRHDAGLALVLIGEPWSLGTVLDRAAELELIRRRHLTDAGRLLLGGAGGGPVRAQRVAANPPPNDRCCCGSCAATGRTTVMPPITLCRSGRGAEI